MSFFRWNLIFLSWLVYLISYARADTDLDIEPQPIGIDFGPRMVIATYAHTAENITILAVTVPSAVDSYEMTIFRLRVEHFVGWEATSHFGPQRQGVVQVAMNLIQPYLPNLPNLEAVMRYPTIKNSATLSWVFDRLAFIAKAVKTYILESPSFVEEELTPLFIKSEFIAVLEEIRTIVYEEYQINITFAILSAPDFFNHTIQGLLMEACAEIGIEHTNRVFPRTYASVVGSGVEEGARVLAIDQGHYHFAMRSTNQFGQSAKGRDKLLPRFLPLEYFGSASIDKKLINPVISSSDAIRAQIEVGASRGGLEEAIAGARFLIKDNIDAEMIGEGMNEDHHHKEWPLDLSNWGVGGTHGAVLSWDDVQAVEEDYVEHVADAILNFLNSLQQARTKSKALIPEEIDAVAILTDHHDGALVSRAVHRALGGDMRVVGGSMGNFTMAAKGAGRLALDRQILWKLARGGSVFDALRDEL